MAQVKLILMLVVLVLGWEMALKGRKPVSGGAVNGVTNGKRAPEARYLALGDSYTIGEAVGPVERYPVQLRRLLEDSDGIGFGDPEIVATTGWTTGNLLEALSGRAGSGREIEVMGSGDGTGGSYDLVSLLIGVNNQFQGRSRMEYRQQFERLLRQSIRLAGNRAAHVVVLSIPDYSVTPFGRAGDTALIAAQIDSFNFINAEVARMYKVNYIDVTPESRKAATDQSLIAADGLHFSGREYAIWARLMEPVVKRLMSAAEAATPEAAAAIKGRGVATRGCAIGAE